MNRTLRSVLVLCVLLGTPAVAPGAASGGSMAPPTPILPPEEGAVVAQVSFASQADLNRLGGELDVWEVDHSEKTLVALLRPGQIAALERTGHRVKIDEERTSRLERPVHALGGQTSGIPGFSCYRTVEELYADMAHLATDRPELATWVKIGSSWERTTGDPPGYDLHALVLTSRAVPGPKPRFLLMAAIHARELTTGELAARFAEHLVAQYGSDPDVTWLLDYGEVHILPMANPDGRKLAESGRSWRKNTDDDDGCTFFPYYGADLNRNSSFHWGGASQDPCSSEYQGPAPASEPETQAIQSYVESIFPDQRGPGDDDPALDEATGVFISLHSYSELVLFPYGFRPTSSPNHAQLETLGRKFGYFNGYQVCQSGEPGCIYATTGTTDDWAYGELGLAAYTFELGTEFFEACPIFEDEVLPDNLPALLYAFKAARRPYQTPAGPETLAVATVPTTVVAGTPITLTAVADDTRYDSHGYGDEPVQPIAAARYTVDAPSWAAGSISHPLSAADGAFDASSEAIRADVDTTGWEPGRHTLFVEAQDADGNWGVPTAAFVWIAGARDGGITGTVREASSGVPVEGATVRLIGRGLEEEQVTGLDGHYAFSVYPGAYMFTATAAGYVPIVLPQVAAQSGMTITQNLTLWPYFHQYLPLIP